MNLREQIREAYRSGKLLNATVEAVILGQATVVLNDSGTRLTNLTVMSGNIEVGDKVLVDYSAGTPPTVRPLSDNLPPFIPPDIEEAGIENVVGTIADLTFHIIANSAQIISVDDTKEIVFDVDKFGNTYPINGSRITLPNAGFFNIIAHIAFIGYVNRDPPIPDFESNQDAGRINNSFMIPADDDIVELELVGNTYGVFGYCESNLLDTEPTVPIIVQVTGIINAVAGEEIFLRVTNRCTTYLDIPKDSNNLYPRIMGVRMNQDANPSDIQSITSYDQQFPTVDDSDIDIIGNEGRLHVEDSPSTYVRSIANATFMSDEEITLTYRFADIVDGGTFRVAIRASGDWATIDTPTKAYELEIENTGNYRINRIEGGVRTLLDSYSLGPTLFNRKIRFQANGDDIRARIWLSADAEPGWQLDIDDSVSGFTTPGTLQIGYWRIYGDHVMFIDDISLHTP